MRNLFNQLIKEVGGTPAHYLNIHDGVGGIDGADGASGKELLLANSSSIIFVRCSRIIDHMRVVWRAPNGARVTYIIRTYVGYVDTLSRYLVKWDAPSQFNY